MATLDKWIKFADVPLRLNFTELSLIGHDHGDDRINGTGHVILDSFEGGIYKFAGTPVDLTQTFLRFRRMQENPYEALARFRLIGTDQSGVEWNCGWTRPIIENIEEKWRVSGRIRSLSAGDTSDENSQNSSVELVVPVRGSLFLLHFLSSALGPRQGKADGDRVREIEVLGSKISFRLTDGGDWLFVTAQTSEQMPHPYLENWLCEPLRIMFGQLVFPRLVARNFGGGRTAVWVRPVPKGISDGVWTALWRTMPNVHDANSFWQTYSSLLKMIALSRDEGERPNFEANPVTEYYQELIMGAEGSRWVWGLTLCGAVEALAKRLLPKVASEGEGGAKAASAAAKISDFRSHILSWSGDQHLKQLAISAIYRSSDTTTAKRLRHLRSQGIISEDQLKTWMTIRNRIAHGERLSQYSDEKEDRSLVELSRMVHELTKALALAHSG